MVNLLDVNVLVALVWDGHVHHASARRWFEEIATHEGWATCPMTELGTIRVCAQPPARLLPVWTSEQLNVLRRTFALRHVWWPDSLSPDAMSEVRDAARAADVPDRYLLGLARRYHGRLATFDRRLAAEGSREAVCLMPSRE